jgi:hypothetical protein
MEFRRYQVTHSVEGWSVLVYLRLEDVVDCQPVEDDNAHTRISRAVCRAMARETGDAEWNDCTVDMSELSFVWAKGLFSRRED